MEYDNDRLIRPANKAIYYYRFFILLFYPAINAVIFFPKAPSFWFVLVLVSAILFPLYFLYGRVLDTVRLVKNRVALSIAVTLLFYLIAITILLGIYTFMRRFQLEPGYFEYFRFDLATILRETLWIALNMSLSVAINYIVRTDEAVETTRETRRENMYYKLRYLRSQLNPHFLFNTLNSIYALSLRKSEQTPEVVVRLADTVRYLIYECNEDRIPLNREIEFINNYIEIEKIRHKADIRFNVEGNTDGIMIEPFLFISYIENGFKHAIDNSFDEPFIYITLKVKEEYLLLNVINSSNADLEQQAKRINGKGITTSKNMLELLYPDRYDLNIIQTDLNAERNGELRLVHARERLESLYPDAHTLDVILSNNTFTVSLMIKTKAA